MSAPTPATVGELRRRLAELGEPWTVDPRLADDDPLPDPPRGGQLPEDLPAELRAATPESPDDLRVVLQALPPSNPFLRERWAELGLSPDEMPGTADTQGAGG
jgi:hypothetical protein